MGLWLTLSTTTTVVSSVARTIRQSIKTKKPINTCAPTTIRNCLRYFLFPGYFCFLVIFCFCGDVAFSEYFRSNAVFSWYGVCVCVFIIY